MIHFFTNRRLHPQRTGLKLLGDELSDAGPTEVRLVRATRTSKWNIEVVPEDAVEISDAERSLLGLAPGASVFPSHRIMLDIAKKMIDSKSHLLFYLHGYNSTVEEVLGKCEELQEKYKVQVLAFSWPANDAFKGSHDNYRSDKLDARLSAGAVQRVFAKLKDGMAPLLRGTGLTINLVAHSMGCYLCEQIYRVGEPHLFKGLFTNVVLSAADCDNPGHKAWLNRVEVRSRVFVTLNHSDLALDFSEDVFGPEQMGRLGRKLSNLDSTALYIDFTDADKVKREHNYFTGKALKNKDVKNFFQAAFTGELAENTTRGFAPGLNTWRIRRFAGDVR